MKISPVKQFVASNVSRFERKNEWGVKAFDLYDKNNLYRGEYRFDVLKSSSIHGVGESLSITKIFDKNLKQKMQEIVHMKKDYVEIKDKSSEFLVKALPKEITTTKTVLNYEKDKFETVRTISKLQNKLQKIKVNDPDHRINRKNTRYEELKEKPKYEKVEEQVSKGSISEVNKDVKIQKVIYKHLDSSLKIPYIYW